MSAEAAKTDPKAKGTEKGKDGKGAEGHEKKAGGGKLPLITLLIVTINTVVMSVLGFLVTQLWGQIKGISDKTVALEEAQKKEEEKPVAPPQKEFIPSELGTLYPLEAFLVNIVSEQGQKFLQMQMELELDSAGLEDELTLKRPAIRDAIILLLTSRTFAELKDRDGMRKLRADLKKSINGLLKTGNVKEIYFTQFHFN